MKTLRLLLIVCLAFMVGHFFGSHDIYMAKDVHKDGTESIWYPHTWDIRRDLVNQKEYSRALLKGLHHFYSQDSNLWLNFIKTREYALIDSLNEGDWEEFYFVPIDLVYNK